MTHLIRITLTAAALALLPCAPAQADGDPGLAKQLAARFDGDRSGACVLAAVIDPAGVRRARVCAGTRPDGPPDWDAAMEIGSVTKTMTAYLVADLMARSLWKLDDPIAKFLPPTAAVPSQGERTITVRDLLTHSAGLPALPPGMSPANPADPYADLSEAGLLKALAHTTLAYPIGSRSDYSNFGMMVVSLAVARSDGGSLDAALRERLFKPLGMRASINGRAASGDSVAPGHLPGGARTAPWTIAPNLAGVGMVSATLDAMTRYARAALGDGPPDVVARLAQTQQPLAHGFAMNWLRQTIAGHDLVLHEGGTGGFSSLVALEPAARRGVVLLADTALTDLGGLGEVGLALLGLDVPMPAPRRAIAAPSALQRALVGQWQLGGLAMRIWQAEDGRLMAQAAGQQAFELRHDSAGDFYPATFDALLTPITQAGGAVRAFAWHQGGGVVEATRGDSADQAAHAASAATPSAAAEAAEAPASDAAWRDWVGEYRLTDQFSLHVFEQAGRLMVRGTGQQAIAATPDGADRLTIDAVGAVITFERGADGHVVAAVLAQHGQRQRGLRR